MENRSKLSFINSKKLKKSIFSSYDNDTFVPDHELDVKRNSYSFDEDVIFEKENEDDENRQDIQHNDNVFNEKEAALGINIEDLSNNHYKGAGTYDEEVSKKNTHNAIAVDGNHNELPSDRRHEYPSTVSEDNELKPPSREQASKRSPPLHAKSASVDSTKRNQPYRGAPKKMRSISDTRNPMLFQRLDLKLSHIEGEDAEKRQKKYRHHSEISVLHGMHGDNNVIEEKDSRNIINEPGNIDSEKGKPNRRWMRKLTRYATFDEGSVYLAKTDKPSLGLIPGEDTEAENATETDQPKEASKEGSAQRKISTGKMIKQSMSYGFSKFKQLSITSKSSTRKLDQDYSIIDNDVDLHETSKRLEPLSTTEEDRNLRNNESMDIANTLHMQASFSRRCSSLPDLLDSISICDEELNDLYLPRRMAICPDLAVPAMKQLRTYLVLTRLKQYCIV